MTDKKRVCGGCAWWENTDVMKDMEGCEDSTMSGTCHYEPVEVSKWSSNWCRHWSKTTGWGDQFKFEKRDLERAVKLVLAAGLSTGHADTCEDLVREVLMNHIELEHKPTELEQQAAGFFVGQLEQGLLPENRAWIAQWLEDYRKNC